MSSFQRHFSVSTPPPSHSNRDQPRAWNKNIGSAGRNWGLAKLNGNTPLESRCSRKCCEPLICALAGGASTMFWGGRIAKSAPLRMRSTRSLDAHGVFNDLGYRAFQGGRCRHLDLARAIRLDLLPCACLQRHETLLHLLPQLDRDSRLAHSPFRIASST